MKIKLETDYAFRIVDYLTRGSNFADASEISKAADIPARFARNILQKLVGKGIVISYKGVNGGYKLGRAPEDISLYDVFETTEGAIFISHCLMGEKECVCAPDDKCPYHEIFTQISLEMENKLRGINLSSVANNCISEEGGDGVCRIDGDRSQKDIYSHKFLFKYT